MKTINKLINQMQSNGSEPPSTDQQLTIGEKDLVNWFFLRLETSYGTKFWTQFSDEKTVLLTKREWSAQIIAYSREDLHTAIEKAKELRVRGDTDFEWPDIAKILGLLKNRISPDGSNIAAYLSIHDDRHPDYRPLGIESDEHKAKRKVAGKSALTEMLKGL